MVLTPETKPQILQTPGIKTRSYTKSVIGKCSNNAKKQISPCFKEDGVVHKINKKKLNDYKSDNKNYKISDNTVSKLVTSNCSEMNENTSRKVSNKLLTSKEQLPKDSEIDKLNPEQLKNNNYTTLKEECKALHNENAYLRNKLNLVTPAWVADEFIALYFDILMLKIIGINGKVHLMDPAITHAIKTVTEFEHFLTPQELHSKDIIIIPINDNTEGYKEGGSHWSVLVYSKTEEKFYYYDSLKNYNLSAAKIVAGKLTSYFSLSHTPDIIVLTGTTQDNSYDCGILMLMAVECVIDHYGRHNSIRNLKIPSFNNLECIKKRAYLAYIVINGYNTPKDTVLAFMTKATLIHTDEKTSSSLLLTPTNPTLSSKYTENTQIDKNASVLKNQEESQVINRDKKKVVTKSGDNRAEKSECNNIHKVTIVADSHGRGLADTIKTHCPDLTVSGFVKPGALLHQVCSSLNPQNYDKQDCVIILAGSNDMCSDEPVQNIITNLNSSITSLSNTNVLLCSLPYRYDCKPDDSIHDDILSFNRDIHHLASLHSNVNMVDLFDLKRHHHTRHGQHINKRGKRMVASLIVDSLWGFKEEKASIPPVDCKPNAHADTPNKALSIQMTAGTTSPTSDSSPLNGWPSSPLVSDPRSQKEDLSINSPSFAGFETPERCQQRFCISLTDSLSQGPAAAITSSVKSPGCTSTSIEAQISDSNIVKIIDVNSQSEFNHSSSSSFLKM